MAKKVSKKKTDKRKDKRAERRRAKAKRPPIRYRRGVPKEMVKVEVSMIANPEIETGTLLEFSYGVRQKVGSGKVGGWKHDPKPVLLVFHDDGDKYIEGLNTNYLSDYYIRKLKQILRRFPGVKGDELYRILKRTASYAIKKGYRKYIRSSLRNEYVYVYEDELAEMLKVDPFASEDEEYH